MLETTALACERGGLRLFAGLSFTLGQGGLLRVLRTLAGLTRPAAGTLRWRGSPIDGEYRKEMLFFGHAPGMKDELTVLENLEFSSMLSALKNSDCKKALEQLGVARLADLPARYLSQGQRRRAALARLALSADVPLWLLDEPFAALDAEGIAQLSALCAAHLAAGGMLVLTSHQDVAISSSAPQEIELR
jgi:heme exporter protein A